MTAAVADPTAGADAGAVRDLANRLRVIGDAASQVKSSLHGDNGSWTGVAADRFNQRLNELPPELDRVSGAFHHAADALTTWANDIEHFQAQAHAAVGQVWTLQRAASAPLNTQALATPAALAAQQTAAANLRRAQANLNHIGQDFATRAHVCAAQIDGAALPQHHLSLGALAGDIFRAGKRAAKIATTFYTLATNTPMLYGELKGDAKTIAKASADLLRKATISPLERAVKRVGKFAGKIKTGARTSWLRTLGGWAKNSTREITKIPGFKQLGRLGGRTVAVLGIVENVSSAVNNFKHGKILDGLVDSVGALAGTVVLVDMVATAAVAAAALAGGEVVALPAELAVAATIATVVGAGVVVYQNRHAIGGLLRIEGNATVEDFDMATHNQQAISNADAAKHRAIHQTWTAFLAPT